MALQRINLRLTELRCLVERDHGGSGGSDPYLWTTFFAFGAQQIPGQTGPVGVFTPAYDAFRVEFPNNMRAGQAVPVPLFISSASFDMDLDTEIFKMVGCIAALMEEDETPQDAIVAGRIAFSKEIEIQLNSLVTRRLQAGDTSGITPQETKAIGDAVEAKVKSAIRDRLSISEILFDNQDDSLGFTFKTFSNREIAFGFFDFPEIKKESDASNRFLLSGNLFLGPIPTEPVQRCVPQKAALDAKKEEIKGLRTRREILQTQLQTATPQQKSAIISQITVVGNLLTAAETTLPAFEKALKDCLSGPIIGGTHVDPIDVILIQT